MSAIVMDGCAVIPAPLVTLRRERARGGNGNVPLGVVTTIELTGTLAAWKGSPSSSGTFWTAGGYPPDEAIALDSRLASLLAKQSALSELFSREGRTLEIQPYDGSAPLRFNPRFKGVTFDKGIWVDRCEYTATFEADTGGGEAFGIADCNEDWAIEQADERGRTFRLSHGVGAVGRTSYDENGVAASGAWEVARRYALGRLGLGIDGARMFASGVLDADGLQAFNYVRSEKVSELGGSYSVEESWLCFAPGEGAAAVEDFTVSTRIDDAGRVSVTAEGSIQGLEKRDNTTGALVSTRAANAEAKLAEVGPSLFARAQAYSGEALHPVSTAAQVGRNENNGTISYTYAWDNRPTASIDGAVSESISLSYSNPADVFARIPVLGRLAGPVLQNIGATTETRLSVSIEAVMRAASQTYTPVKPDTAALILSLAPVATQVFVDSDVETFSPTTGRYGRQTTYTWQ